MSRLGDYIGALFTLRGIVSIVGKLCLLAAVGFTFAAGEHFHEPANLKLPKGNYEPKESGNTQMGKPTLQSYRVILDQSIFGPKTPKEEPVVAAPTKLKLRLVGTNLGRGDQRFAIIEDSSKGDQDVFSVSEMVFNQAKLIEVLPDSVKLEHNGRIETLVFDEGSASSGGGDGDAPSGDSNEFAVAESELTDALANLPVLLSQARAVPYFRNGQSIGMRLFAIRKDSMYEKLGLKNGDIVLAVNDNSLSDPSQALKLFEQLKSERQISVKLERNGEQKQLQYSIR